MSAATLLYTKLMIPRLADMRIERGKLTERVLHNVKQRVTIITAPPGYGKTTLLVDVAQQLDLPVLWYQLDENDNDPVTFLAYLLEGLHRILPGSVDKVRQLLYSGEPLPAHQILTVLLNTLLEADQNWVLVLDDYHYIDNPTVHQLTTDFVENRPQGILVLLASRTTPDLPLHRWRARNQVVEFREEQLRFMPSETQQWVQQAIPDIPSEIVAAIADKTEGWGAGVQLAITLLLESQDQNEKMENVVNRLGGTHPYIFHYLMEEIFKKQPAATQTFLLHTALCQQVNAQICRDVLGFDDPDTILDQLQRDHLFLSRLDQQWYRYHQLFQEFLKDKFQRQDSAMVKHLNHKLGVYFCQKGDYEAALYHFLDAESFDLATQALEAFAFSYIEQGRVNVLHHYLKQFKDITDHPALLVIMSYVQRYQGNLTAAIQQLERAHQLATAEGNAALSAQTLTQLANIARSRGDYSRANQLAARAVQESPNTPLHTRALALMEQAKSEGFLKGMALGYDIARRAIRDMEHASNDLSSYQQAQLLHSFGQICYWSGAVDEAIYNGECARDHLGDTPSRLAAEVLSTLAIPYLYRLQHDKALRYAERALKMCQALNLQEQIPNAYAVLGNVLTRLGQLPRAENCLRQAIKFASDLGAASYAHVMASGYLAYNLVAQQRIQEAQQIAQHALLPYQGDTMVYEIYVCQSVLADTYLETSQHDQAEAIFTHLVCVGEERGYRIPLAMAYFGLAYLQFQRMEEDAGFKNAQRSLELLAPTGAWELYVDQGERARLVCQKLHRQIPEHRFLEYVLTELDDRKPESCSPVEVRSELIRVQTFGTFSVWRGDQKLTAKAWESMKARDLLAYFVTYPHDRIPIERAIEAIWQDREGEGTTAFHTALYRLRKALRHEDEKLKFIVPEAGAYRLDTARFEIDAYRFENLIQRGAETGDHELYEAAVALYQGRYLENFYYDWALREAERLARLYVQTLGNLRQFYAQQGLYQKALELARLTLKENDFLEDVHCDMMVYYHHLGNRQGIVKQFELLKNILHDELSVDPLPETLELYNRLMS